MPLVRGPSLVSYTQITANVTVNGGTEALADTVITAPALAADGISSFWIEFWCPDVALAASCAVNLWLYDGAASVGQVYQQYNGANGLATGEPTQVRFRVTPSAGSHTYSIRASQQFGVCTINAGAGGAGVFMPASLAISRA